MAAYVTFETDVAYHNDLCMNPSLGEQSNRGCLYEYGSATAVKAFSDATSVDIEYRDATTHQ